jgi:hypothetical protein
MRRKCNCFIYFVWLQVWIRGFVSRWCLWGRLSLLVGKVGRCVGLTMLSSSCADCLEIWEPQTPGILRAFPGMWLDCFTFYFVWKHSLNILLNAVAEDNLVYLRLEWRVTGRYFVPSSCGVRVWLVTAWAREQRYAFLDGAKYQFVYILTTACVMFPSLWYMTVCRRMVSVLVI